MGSNRGSGVFPPQGVNMNVKKLGRGISPSNRADAPLETLEQGGANGTR
jgi:hypothetical protein